MPLQWLLRLLWQCEVETFATGSNPFIGLWLKSTLCRICFIKFKQLWTSCLDKQPTTPYYVFCLYLGFFGLQTASKWPQMTSDILRSLSSFGQAANNPLLCFLPLVMLLWPPNGLQTASNDLQTASSDLRWTQMDSVASITHVPVHVWPLKAFLSLLWGRKEERKDKMDM